MFTRLLYVISASLLILSIVVLIGCGGGSNGGGRSGFAKGVTRGIVTLPPGFPLAANALHLATSHGSVPIAANGAFTIPNPGAGPSLLSLVDASNHLVMLGFVDPSTTNGSVQINPGTTSQALLFYALGAYMLPADQYSKLLQILANAPETQALTSVVTARLAAHATALTDDDPQIETALNQAHLSLIGSQFASRAASGIRNAPANKKAPHIAPTGIAGAKQIAAPVGFTVTRRAAGRDTAGPLILVDPNPSVTQSGVEIGPNPTGDGIIAINNFRRPIEIFIYKTGSQGQAEQNLNPPQPLGSAISVPATNRLSGIIQSSTDSLTGKSPFAPVTSPPILLPLDAGVQKTIYTVVVLGPGLPPDSLNVPLIFSGPKFQTFLPVWQAHLTSLQTNSFVKDIFLPAILTFMFNTKAVNAALGNDSDVLSKDIASVLSKTAPDVITTITKPNADKSDYLNALKIIFKDLTGSVDFLNALLTTLFKDIPLGIIDIGSVKNVANLDSLTKANVILNTFDKVFKGVDIGKVLLDLSSSHVAETWTATAVQHNVHLDPSPALVSVDSSVVVLTASIPGQADLSKFRFVWSTTGRPPSAAAPVQAQLLSIRKTIGLAMSLL